MLNRPYVAAALLAVLTLLPAAPAFAAGEILITHAKALAGNVTPGDTAGYPVTISIPGNFQLASNLFVAADKIGIQVTGANATIDLNGFTMQGSNVAWHGITGGVDGVTIKNGTITGFEFDGINGTAAFWTVENMQVVGNGRFGIYTEFGSHARFLNNTVAQNGSSGIVCGLGCLVEDSIVSENGAHGVFAQRGTVLGNTIVSNNGFGIGGGSSGVGFGNNTLVDNNNGNAQVAGGLDLLHPNACTPACP
jgi:hypothetical protein